MYASMLIALTAGAQPQSGEEWDRAKADAAKQRDALVKRLSDEHLWLQPKREEELMACLKAARAFPDPRMTPILLKHLASGPSAPGAGVDPFRMTLEDRVPVLGALASIGPSAIPEVVETLRKTESAKEVDLLALLVWAIYDGGGFGKELAVERLELELRNTKLPKERENLQKAIKRLRPPNDTKGKS